MESITGNLIDIKFTRTHHLSEQTRAEVCSILYNLIATYIDAKGHILEAHWNSEGVSFNSIHEIFDRGVGLVEGFVDPLGERIRAFGAFASANLSFASGSSLLMSYTMTHSIQENIRNVVSILKCISGYLYIYIETLDKIDKVTCNVLQEHALAIDTLIYLIQSNIVIDNEII